jgi:hypothetical protein
LPIIFIDDFSLGDKNKRSERKKIRREILVLVQGKYLEEILQ